MKVDRNRLTGFFLHLTLWVCTASADDWLQYRGPNHNAVSTEHINTQWTGSVTNPVWLVYLTNGLTSLTISDGRAFTQVGGDFTPSGSYLLAHKEFCVALSASNGDVLWQTEIDALGTSASLNPRLFPNGGVGYTDDGPRSTPVVDGGSVYVLSSYLKLYRLNATNGAVIWSTNLVAGFGGSVIAWQNAASPVFEDGLVFVNANCSTSNLMAFHASDGTLAWRAQDGGMTHATPVLATIHGVRQLIFITQSGLVSLNPQTGDVLWRFVYPYNGTSLAASPMVCDDIVFITASYGTGSAAVQVAYSNSTFSASELWHDQSLQSHWTTPVCYQGAMFGQFTPDNANAELRCVDLATGATMWSVGGFGRGAPMLIDTNLVVITERGELVLALAQTNAYAELARFTAIPDYQDAYNKCWNALALSDGQLYVRSTAYAARFDLSLPGQLMIEPPQLAAGNTLQFTILTATGTPIDANRLAGIELRASSDISLPPSQWPALTNDLLLTNGVLFVTNVATGPQQRYFIVAEPD